MGYGNDRLRHKANNRCGRKTDWLAAYSSWEVLTSAQERADSYGIGRRMLIVVSLGEVANIVPWPFWPG
jgi:hypothetical protein